MFRFKVLPGEKVLNDGRGRFSKSICKNGTQSDVGDGEGILEPHLLAGTRIDKVVTIAEKFPEFTDFLYGNIAGRNDVELEKVGDPHGIFVISFLALNSPNVFGVGNNDMKMPLKDIENGDPVFTSGFHADLRTTVFEKPVTAGLEVRVKGGEPLFLISGNTRKISGGDTDSNKFLVDVHTGTIAVNNTQHKKPPFKRSRH